MIKNLMSQFFIKNKPIIGLDIGKAEVKMVLLEGKSLDTCHIKAYATQSLLIEKKKDPQKNQQNAPAMDPSMEELEKVSTAIKKCWKKLETQVKEVAIALPSTSVVIKKTILPKFDNLNELEEKVRSEIESTTPFSLDEVNIDFQVLGPNESSPTENDVVIWATRKEKVEDCVAVVESAGLIPVVLDIENCTFFNSLQFVEEKINPSSESNQGKSSVDIDLDNKTASPIVKKNLSIVIDMGYSSTKLIVFKNLDMTYNRESEVGLIQLNDMIINRFGIENISEVEKSKRGHSLPVEYTLEILPQFLTNYAQEIARLVEFFFSATASSQEAVKGIYLTGGGAAIDGISAALSKAMYDKVLQDKITLLSIPHYLAKNEKISLSVLQKDEYSLTVACGLAMRRYLKVKNELK